MLSTITTPTLVLNRNTCLENIRTMGKKAQSHNLKFRPHFKTHQSIEIGSWFKEYPIDGITVSSLKMAEFFAKNGWDSITIAFPVNILDTVRIHNLASSIDLRVLVVNTETMNYLDEKLTSKLGVYIEIDPGYGRSGVSYLDDATIKKLIKAINSSENLSLYGFYSHAGHSYKSRSKDEILNVSIPIITELSELKNKYNLPVCFGDTPSCSVLNDFGNIDEISPGNFVFYDWIQTKIGSCSPNEIAVAMYCPVVAKYPTRKELLIHGGAVHFSKDLEVRSDLTPSFGQVVQQNEIGWGKPIEDCYLKSISQEHGVIACNTEFYEQTSVGDLVAIVPIHSCLTADLMGSYLTTDGIRISNLLEKRI